jgi:hypothetical protein
MTDVGCGLGNGAVVDLDPSGRPEALFHALPLTVTFGS